MSVYRESRSRYAEIKKNKSLIPNLSKVYDSFAEIVIHLMDQLIKFNINANPFSFGKPSTRKELNAPFCGFSLFARFQFVFGKHWNRRSLRLDMHVRNREPKAGKRATYRKALN